jgi:hypothetical protein
VYGEDTAVFNHGTSTIPVKASGPSSGCCVPAALSASKPATSACCEPSDSAT